MRLFEFLRRLAPAGLAGCLLAGLAGCAQPQRQSVSWFDVFDTVTILQGYTTSEEEFSEQAAALKVDLTEYHQLYDIYNSYPDMNNLKTVNDNAGVAPVQVDQKIIDLVKLGKEMYELTDGRVNIAMGSVLSLWHDAREAGLANPESAALPGMEALEEAAAHTDIDQVILDEEAGTIYLADPFAQRGGKPAGHRRKARRPLGRRSGKSLGQRGRFPVHRGTHRLRSGDQRRLPALLHRGRQAVPPHHRPRHLDAGDLF